jgi:predicted AlkP superfamily pyrophosphatase or phosphodiesterase
MICFLTIPGLRQQDLSRLPNLTQLFSDGSQTRIQHQFPCVTWPSQANMLTGKRVAEHGVIANGFYWRETQQVEMWTAWNEKIQSPQIWDVMRQRNPKLKSAAWFPMLSKGCGADYVCMPAPIHKSDGSEELWCYTKPQEFYGDLLNQLGHFPLKHFWGPLANIKSTDWIVDSAVAAAKKFKPDFFYIYLPHLDYAAQKAGPDSEAAMQALVELNATLGRFAQALQAIDGQNLVRWIAASEYVITQVDHVTYPNRILREAGLLQVRSDEAGKELIDFENSKAWALVDHQFSHVFVKDRDESVIKQVCELFRSLDGIAEVLAGSARDTQAMSHERSGDVILISTRNSWQAYYWWQSDELAPAFAHTVDIHRKPGYDPVELFFDMATKSVPLDATLVKGSHGAPARDPDQQGVLLISESMELPELVADTAIFDITLKMLGI